ncbi:hypothetical protein EO244_14510 [Ancylomarina salipaludis]|uniref:Zf-HC2 domain-containing protein n=1 Tax=Ancylomarina salipaludis TaxID=2501299 RepID=A0A4Q1JIK2_9BACT|nr:hypothetical protein [Ancylomarina salipaludis]RXQ89037.1 hypothetical protein EO244_14510 [Ancylomarina salipaludis]
MRTINRDNYEEFFIDYIEGELNAEENLTLQSFLALNPDLKDELEEMADFDFTLESADINANKPDLKDIPFQTNFDDFCIALIENDLDTYDKKAFEEFIATHPDKQVDLDLYLKTKLKADSTLIFKDKKSLKRRNKSLVIKQLIYTSLATAASIAILFTVWTSEIGKNPADPQYKQFSQNTPIQISTPDSLKKDILKELETAEKFGNTSNSKNVKETIPNKIKGKIQNKQINKIDALPIKAAISPQQMVDKIEVTQLVAENKVVPIKNSTELNLILNKHKEITPEKTENTGLAMLGLSWKASKGENEVKEKSTLLKIASYGVNKIGQLAGKKINLEKKYDPKTDKTRVAFNTYGIGFSTPVK